jgi:hypothetical protein
VQKTWGPFTGRQLTTMIVALIVCVLVPGTVWAVDTFSNVAIEDPVSGVKASVDSAHRLKVGDAAGAMTVDGSVTATEASAANFVRVFAATSSTCSNAYTIPSGKALILKSMQAFIHNAGSPGSDAEAIVYNAANCSGSLVAAAISDRAHENVAQNFEPGIAIPAGHVVATQGFGDSGSVMLYGYLVPASSVPASAAAPAARNGAGTVQGASPTGARAPRN